MAEDVGADVAGLISNSKVFGSSDNIRHGKYKFLIKRIFAQKVTTDKGDHRMAFWELTPLTSEPNPQTEGDRVDYVSPQQPGVGPLKDDGRNPNAVGSNCGLKVDFDGTGGRSAGSNIKGAILGLFGKHDGEIPDAEVNKTWLDLSLQKDLKKGEQYPGTNPPVLADKDRRANPACGMVIYCTTSVKKKKTPNDKGMYVTKMSWECKGSPPGMGENAPELVAARAAEIIAARTDEEEEEIAGGGAQPAPSPYGAAPSPYQPPAPAAPAPAPAVAAWPPAPWKLHTDPKFQSSSPDKNWFWDGAQGLKTEADLRAMFPVPAPVAATPTPPTPPTPAAPVPTPAAPAFPPAPWRQHTDPKFQSSSPDKNWFWDGGQGLKTEADLRAGK